VVLGYTVQYWRGEKILERKKPILWNKVSAGISDFLQSYRGINQQEFLLRSLWHSALGTHRIFFVKKREFMKDYSMCKVT
jgi:hypothetical protein